MPDAAAALAAYAAGDMNALNAYNEAAGSYGGSSAPSVSIGSSGQPSKSAYDAQIASMTAPGSAYAGLNFMTYEQKYGGSGKAPSSVPAQNVARPTPSSGGISLSGGGSPAAAGYDMWQGMMDNVLNTERLRQSAIDQQVNVARLVADLERVSPTRAADLAVSLGIPGLEPNLSNIAGAFTNEATSGVFGGRVGSQDIKLPFAFSGKELSFLGNNPNTASILQDIGDRFGRPDLIKNSQAAGIPTSASLLGSFG